MHHPRSLGREKLSAPDWRCAPSADLAAASPAATPVTEKKYDPFPSYHNEPRPQHSFHALTPDMINHRATYALLQSVHALSTMEQPFKDVVVGPAPDPAKFDADFKTTFRNSEKPGGDVFDEAWYLAGYGFAEEFGKLLAAHPLFKEFMQHSKSNSLQTKLQCRKGKGLYIVYGIEDNPQRPSDCWAVCALKLELLEGGRVRVHRFEQVGGWMGGLMLQVRKDDKRGREAYNDYKAAKKRQKMAPPTPA